MKGDDIGIVFEGKIIALRPVAVQSTDYARREYGIEPDAMSVIEENIHGKIKKERKAGKLREFTGDIEALVAGKSHR